LTFRTLLSLGPALVNIADASEEWITQNLACGTSRDRIDIVFVISLVSNFWHVCLDLSRNMLLSCIAATYSSPNDYRLEVGSVTLSESETGPLGTMRANFGSRVSWHGSSVGH
jgi:hypothetical protein